jgi:Domain of unknown function (DUF4149)
MRVLRYFYVLALVMWLGGMTVAGLVVAPVTFGVLEAWNPSIGRVLAGDVFGAVLGRMSLIGYVAGAVMFVVLTVLRLLGPRPRSYGIRVALIFLMLALTLYADRVTAPRIDELQSQVNGPMNQLPVADVRRVEFDRLHSLATSLTLAAMLGGLALIGWETRE